MNTLQHNLVSSFYTKFYPEWQAFTGCAISTLIIGKLEYWFSKPKYVGGFYKFVEPCAHPLYREGDSWSEELGVSRKLYAKAFDIIGVRYISKSAYLAAEDKFKGKLYASYHDRQTNRTYFIRNHDFTSQLLERLKTSYSSPKKKITKGGDASLRNSPLKDALPNEFPLDKILTHSPPSECVQGRSCNGDLGRSYVRGSSSLQKETSSLEDNVSKSIPLSSQTKEETEEMIKIWKEEIGELGVSSNGLLMRLQRAFKEFFEQSMESWKAYCQMISSSKFLMGEAQNKFFKKAWITWAIRGENIERVKGGDFRLGDRKTNQDKKLEDVDIEIKNIEYKKHQIKMKISNIKLNERKKRRTLVKEKVKTLSEQERLELEQDFEAFLEQENNSMTEEFRKARWKGMFISAYFDSFVEEKIYTQLFGNLDKNHDEKVVQASELLKLLDDVSHELSQIKQKKRDVELGGRVFESKTLKAQALESPTQESTPPEGRARKPMTQESSIQELPTQELSTQGPAKNLSASPYFDPKIFSPLAKVQKGLADFRGGALSWA